MSEVQLAVWELPSQNEIFRVRRDESFSVAPGEEFMLRLFSPRGTNPTGSRAYLSGRIRLLDASGPGQFRLRDVDILRGSAILEVPQGASREQLTLGYRLTANYSAGSLESGRFSVRVEGAPDPRPGPPSDGGGDEIEDEVVRLYRAVLLRDPRAGDRDEIRRVQRDGYPALVALAARLADSPESRFELKRYDDQTRLETLYRVLLDRSRSRVPDAEWKAQRDRWAQGRVQDVVLDLVQSARYVRRFGARPDDDRVKLSSAFVDAARAWRGKPYRIDPLGEGPLGKVDRDPLWTEDAFDAVTLVQTALARAVFKTTAAVPRRDSSASFASDGEIQTQFLNRIRYAGDRPSFTQRHHYFAAEWAPAQSRLLKDLTRESGGSAARSVTRDLPRGLFFNHHGVWPDVGRPEIEAIRKREDLSHTAWYWPMRNADDLIGRLPEGTILVFLGRESWAFTRHVGILTRDDDGRALLLHADPVDGVVEEENLRDYLRDESSRFIGIQALKVRDQIVDDAR